MQRWIAFYSNFTCTLTSARRLWTFQLTPGQTNAWLNFPPFFNIAGASFNPNYNAAPDNNRPSNADVIPPREGVNPNLIFGFPSNNNPYPQMPPPAILDIPRLPDNRQAFPASSNSGGGWIANPPYHPELTPPPNVFGPFPRNNFVTTTKEPSLLDQFLYNKSPRNASAINSASLNLTLISLLFLLIYRIRNNLAWIGIAWLGSLCERNYFWYILSEVFRVSDGSFVQQQFSFFYRCNNIKKNSSLNDFFWLRRTINRPNHRIKKRDREFNAFSRWEMFVSI